MIGYITVGSNDLAQAAGFFDPLLATLGVSRTYTPDHQIARGFGQKRPMLVVTRPFDGDKTTAGNGTMVALKTATRVQVDETHGLALALGGTDDGAPGQRGPRFYGGYFRDLDGNKFNVFLMT